MTGLKQRFFIIVLVKDLIHNYHESVESCFITSHYKLITNK